MPGLHTNVGAKRAREARARLGLDDASPVVFTDGVFIGDGFDARRPVTERALRRFVDRWAARLSGLRGAEVSFVGVGYGTAVAPRALETSRRAAEAVLTAAGAEMKDWNVRLAPEERGAA